jgi:hypothetical protein
MVTDFSKSTEDDDDDDDEESPPPAIRTAGRHQSQRKNKNIYKFFHEISFMNGHTPQSAKKIPCRKTTWEKGLL